jgi:hypothetical protein
MTKYKIGDPNNWTVPSAREDDGFKMIIKTQYVCYNCFMGECVSCSDKPQGRQYERSDDAAKRLGTGCLCKEQGHPVSATCSESAGGYGRGESSHRCSKPAKGTVEVHGSWSGAKGQTVTKQVCGLHLRMYNKRAEEAQARVEAEEQRRMDNARAGEEAGAADETVEMLNEACRLFGIELEAIRKGGEASWGKPTPVRIEIDTEAAGALARFLMERFG